MPSAFKQAMAICDDCAKSGKPLGWFGRNIRICAGCRATREQNDGRRPTTEEGA